MPLGVIQQLRGTKFYPILATYPFNWTIMDILHILHVTKHELFTDLPSTYLPLFT